MARPRKGAEIGASVHLGVRITAEMREALDDLARRNGRALADEVRAALEAHVEAHKIAGRRRRSA